MQYWQAILILIIGYGLGNIATGVIVSKYIAGGDLRNFGSGASGGTNALRTTGWIPAVITVVGDGGKSLLAAIVGWLIAGASGAMLGATAAIIGHNWPIVFGFRGGKGIAATAGALILISPLLFLLYVIVLIAVVFFTRTVSIGSLSALVAFLLGALAFNFGNVNLIAFALVALALGFYCHRDNIKRIINREEKKIDFSKIPLFKSLKL